jgi:hypothetical protein
VSKAAASVRISGKITARPNPIPPLGGSSTKIIWETNDPLGAEVHVRTEKEGDKLVARGTSGSAEIDWIVGSTPYHFELYGVSKRDRCLDRVVVRQSDGAFEDLIKKVSAEAAKGNIDLQEIARFVAELAPRCVNSPRYPEFFRLWEQRGLHVTPVHFYQPIPDTRNLPESLWAKPGDLAGIDMNEAFQLDLLRNCFPKFRDEYEQFFANPSAPGQFHFDNGRFDGTDALVTYAMVRYFKPKTIIEVGSGYSSLISGKAAERNGNKPLICIEPFPLDFLRQGFPGLRALVEKKIEEVELDFFSQLKSNDILFIDSSHTVKIGGDVNYLFLEVLPRLNPGVIVHVHDILLPFDYRRDWVMDEFRFWTEQYLLQAFLTHNAEFEVLFANNYMAHYHLAEFKNSFPHSPWWGGGSFWMRRRADRSTTNRVPG